MSGEVDNNGGLSRAKIQSLTGQILKKLDAADGEQNGKIKGSIWNQFFNGDGKDIEGVDPGRKDGVNTENDEISLSEVFDKLMTRIFNAAKQAVGASAWQDGDGNLTQSAHNKINEVAKNWLGKAENITAAEEDDEVKEEDDADAEAKQALAEAEEAAGEIKTSVTNMAPQIGVVINRLNTAKVTEGKIKEEVEAEKADIQKQIDKLKEKVAKAKQNIEALKENIKDKTEVKGYTEADQAIADAEASISSTEKKITELEQALADIKTDGLKTKEQSVSEKAEATKKDLVEKKKAKLESKRVINGKEQEYYKYDDADGKTHRVIVDPQTGEEEELVIISDGPLKKKEFATKSLYDNTLSKLGISEVPKGIVAYVGFDTQGQPGLRFRTEDNDMVKPRRLKFIADTVDDNYREKIKDIKTGLGGKIDYEISPDGSYSIKSEHIFSLISSDFDAHHLPVAADSKGDYHMGPVKSKDMNSLQKDYQKKAQTLALKTTIYQDLAKKSPESLNDGEKAFMKQVEQELLEYFNAN